MGASSRNFNTYDSMPDQSDAEVESIIMASGGFWGASGSHDRRGGAARPERAVPGRRKAHPLVPAEK